MTAQTEHSPPTLLAPKAVAARTSLSWRTIQRKVRSQDFPKPVKLSDNRIAFREAEVNAWIESLQVAA